MSGKALAAMATVGVFALLVSASATPALAGASPGLTRADQTAPTYSEPPRITGVEMSSAGIAWEVGGDDGGLDHGDVHYSTFNGPQDVDAGTVGTEPDYVEHDFSLIGDQLYLPQPSALQGVDITTGAALPDRHDCIRTGSGCFTIDQAPVSSAYSYSYTPDSTGTTTDYPPLTVDGTSTGDDRLFVRAIDGDGVILEAFRSLLPASSSVDVVLAYLDFSTGDYTVLDSTASAFSSEVAMDSSHIVWTRDGQVLYLNRDDLAAAPVSATPDGAVGEVAVNGDTLAYLTTSPDEPHTTTFHVGALGGDTFTTVADPYTTWGDLLPIDNGDFAALAGNTASDYGIYRISPGSTSVGSRLALFGFAPPQPVSDDFDGQARSEPALINAAHTWSIDERAPSTTRFGRAGDVATVTDNRAGTASIGVYRPANGTWYTRIAEGGTTRTRWGTRGDLPVAAHYRGQHQASVLAVFRPTNGTWHIKGAREFQLGRTGDIPVPGHYAGTAANDYADQPAVYRPSTSTWYVRGQKPVHFGQAGDIPAPGDYNGDGRTDIAVYRPADHTWYIRGRRPVSYGATGDIPVTGDFNGDGRTDIAVYRPADHTWYIHGLGKVRFAGAGGRPVDAAPHQS